MKKALSLLFLDAVGLLPLWINSGHNVFNRAVFSSGVRSLED
jgi:hypothetical protein